MTAEEKKHLEQQADAMDRRRFVKLFPRRLDARDLMGLMELNLYWMDQSEHEDRMVELCRELWDTSSASLVNALDCRDDMISIHFIDYIYRQVRHNARALKRLRRSPKLIPWLLYILDDTRMGGAVPMQEPIMSVCLFVITGCSKSFFRQLLDCNIPSILFRKIRTCDPPNLRRLGNVLESTIKLAKDYCDGSEDDGSDNVRRIHVMCQVASRMICDRAMHFDFRQQRFRSSTPKEFWVDVGDVAGTLASMLILLGLYFSIPTPMEVRQHLGAFGDSYTPWPPTDPLERDRWSERYFCKRLKEVDFSTEDGKEDGSEIMKGYETKAQLFADQRFTSIRCGQCQRVEVEDELFSKCSRCKMVYYCSRECQNTHWKSHKKTCTRPAKESLPEPLLDWSESIHLANATVDESCHDYPTMFAVWLHEHYRNKN